VVVAALSLRVVVQRPAHYAAPSAAGSAESSEPQLTTEQRYQVRVPIEIHLTVTLSAPDTQRLLQAIFDALVPGGTLIIGDHEGAMGLFGQMKAMEAVGFAEVDCSWREREYFVCGGQRPRRQTVM
jgi:hypothetical protein